MDIRGVVSGLILGVFFFIIGSFFNIMSEEYSKNLANIRCLELEMGKEKCDLIFKK